MEEKSNSTWRSDDGNIYHLTKDEDGIQTAIREKDGMIFHAVRIWMGALIPEEEYRELIEDAIQSQKEYEEALDAVGGNPLNMDFAVSTLSYFDAHTIRNANIYAEKLYLDEELKELRYTTEPNPDKTKREDATIYIKPKEEKLSEIITNLPYGLIDKQVTGIGATHLELDCKRNSIIVTPTRTLALNKSRDGKGKFFYVGTKKGNSAIKKDEIKAYLDRADIEYKKILVVADSLDKVISAITEQGEDVFSNYYLLVDEIDTLQSDNHFRPLLSKVIDYYFKFGLQRRALLSATVREFSHPKLQHEPVTTFEAIDKPLRNIHIYYTDSINVLLSKKIIEMAAQHPAENILIAYNSVINIRQIIKSLEDKIPTNTTLSILCSESSMGEAGEYFNRLDEQHKLPCRINFMTSTYFAGIDIKDTYHLITVCDSRKVYSALTISKIIQIHGRCREDNGILSDTIIYNNSKKPLKNLRTYKEMLKNKADKVIGLLHAADKLKQNDADLTDLFGRIHKAIIERATERLFEQQEFELIRETIDNELEVSYFNIDALYEKMEAYHKYYSSKEGLYKHIKEIYPATIFHDDSSVENDNERLEAEEKSFKEEQKEESKARLQQKIASAKDELISFNREYGVDEYYIDERIEYSKGRVKEYYSRIKKYLPYYDVEFLANIFAEIAIMNKKAYRNLNNTLIFRAFDDKQPFKAQVLQNFKIGVKYSSEQIADILNTVIKDQHFKTLLNHQRTLLNHFKSFVDCTYTGGKYIVKNFKPKYKGIKGKVMEIPEPKERISKNDVAIKFFDL